MDTSTASPLGLYFAPVADLAQAIRILTANVGMSTHDRRSIALALGDDDPWEAVVNPPADPRDAEIARLRAQLATTPSSSAPVGVGTSEPAGAPSPQRPHRKKVV